MPQIRVRVKTSLALLMAGFLLGSCGKPADREAELVAAPIRYAIADLAKNPKWEKGRCLCAAIFRGEAVEDLPKDLLQAEFATHPWVRNWSECAVHYGKKDGIAVCKAGMTDYICSTATRNDLPAGTTRVLCHVNGKNELLFDEYDVTRQEERLTVKVLSMKSLTKTYDKDRL
jgi:hypothetical protein